MVLNLWREIYRALAVEREIKERKKEVKIICVRKSEGVFGVTE